MCTPFQVLFSLTLHRDGTIEISGRPREGAIPDILRMIAAALESGALTLRGVSGDEEEY